MQKSFSKRPPLHWIGENRAEEGGAPALHGVQKVSCLEYLPDGQPLSIMLQERGWASRLIFSLDVSKANLSVITLIALR